MGVSPHDPCRTLLWRALLWLREYPEEAPRLGRLSRPEPVIWAESRSNLTGLTALRLPGRDEPGAPPVGRAQARWGLPAKGARHPGDPGVRGLEAFT